MPAPQGDRPGFVGRLNRETIVFRDPAASLARPVSCTCSASPWCDGPTGAHWLTCSHTCRSCNPPKRRRPPEHLRGERADG